MSFAVLRALRDTVFPVRRALIGLLLLAAAACSEPPQKEIDQAQSAIDAARAAGADTGAAAEYAGATETLQKARASVDQRDYRQALSYAIDARQRAAEATALVAAARTRQKASAEAEYATAAQRGSILEADLHAAESARVPAQQLRTAREALDAAKGTLQEARRRLDGGNTTDAEATLVTVREKLDLAAKAVQAIPQHGRATRRRH
ncbi:MAG TPA: DUF4398 domain-containing protein [Vicinamibacterales bacterium]